MRDLLDDPASAGLEYEGYFGGAGTEGQRSKHCRFPREVLADEPNVADSEQRVLVEVTSMITSERRYHDNARHGWRPPAPAPERFLRGKIGRQHRTPPPSPE
jgi:hypothetical protein